MPYLKQLAVPPPRVLTSHEARQFYRAAKSGGQDVPPCLLGMAFRVAESEPSTRKITGQQLQEALKRLQVDCLPYRAAPKTAEATEVSCRIDGVEVPEVALAIPKRIGPAPLRKLLYAAGTLAGMAAGLYVAASDAAFSIAISVVGEKAASSVVVALGTMSAFGTFWAMAQLWSRDTEENLLLLAGATEAAIRRALANFLGDKGEHTT